MSARSDSDSGHELTTFAALSVQRIEAEIRDREKKGVLSHQVGFLTVKKTAKGWIVFSDAESVLRPLQTCATLVQAVRFALLASLQLAIKADALEDELSGLRKLSELPFYPLALRILFERNKARRKAE